MYETIPPITGETFPCEPVKWRNESYPFKYVVCRKEENHRGEEQAFLLEILEGGRQAWDVRTHTCGDIDPPWTIQFLQPGLWIVEGVRRIMDNPGATDWNSEWIEVLTCRELTGPELYKLKREKV